MARTDVVGSKAICTDRFRAEETTCRAGTALDAEGRPAKGASRHRPDSLAAGGPRAETRKRLARMCRKHRAPWEGGSTKLEQGVSPSPTLERDRRVVRYRYDARAGRYQVTQYDPKLVAFSRSGRPLIGPQVTINKQRMRLDDGIATIRGWAQAKLRALAQLRQAPLGSGVVLSRRACKPVAAHLRAADDAAALAGQLLKAGEPRQAQRTLLAATKALNAGSVAFKKAQRDIEGNVKTTITVLKVVRAIGELAEVGLVTVGAGAAARGVASLARSQVRKTLLQAGVSAALKGAYGGADSLRDQVLDIDKKVDWKRVGTDTVFASFQALLSDSITARVTQGMLRKAGKATPDQLKLIQRAMAQGAGNFTGALTKLAASSVELAQKEGLTPRQAVKRTLARQSSWELLKAAVASGVGLIGSGATPSS